MDYLPITVQLKGRQCLIVGGGEVAARKLKHLLKAGSQVTLVSKRFTKEVLDIANSADVKLIESAFAPEHLEDAYLVIATTDDEGVNQQVSEAAQAKNIWVNVVDNLELCTFIMPAVIDRSPLLIAISSSGISPVLARKIREKIEWLLPRSLGRLLQKLKLMRPQVKKKFSSFQDKRAFSEWYIESAIKQDDTLDKPAEVVFMDYLKRHKTSGKVFLVGAGPGAVDLLTVKALKVLQKADIVLYDALVSPEILDCIRRDATLVHVGKRAGRHYVKQSETNALLLDYARQGLRVVRLKGGDPFVFGRGGEELQVLRQHGINYEVVPGITAAAGCASYAGIPLTHREHSKGIQLVTAHEKSGDAGVDWLSLAKSQQTLVFYMGLSSAIQIREQLIKHGMPDSTDFAVIEKGTTAQQRVITGVLGELPEQVENYQVESPALIIVGSVSRFADELAWFKQGKVISTRPDERWDAYPLAANQRF